MRLKRKVPLYQVSGASCQSDVGTETFQVPGETFDRIAVGRVRTFTYSATQLTGRGWRADLSYG